MTEIAILPHLWIIPLVSVVLLGLGFLWYFVFEVMFDGGGGWEVVGIIWWVFSGVTALASLASLVPFQSQYHVFYELRGTVTEVSNQFENGSGELTGYTVLTLDTYDEPIVTSSSRLTASKPGDDLTLLCTLSWEPYGLDTTYCGLRAINN